MLVMLKSALDSEGFGGLKMTAEECLNSAMVALNFPLLRHLSLDHFDRDGPGLAELCLRGRLLSTETQLLDWRPAESPAMLPSHKPLSETQAAQAEISGRATPLPLETPIGQPDWLKRRTDTGALAEFFVFNLLREAYGNSFPLSAWVSSAKRRFFPDDRSRVNDALGADFEFQDTLGIFAKKKGALLRLEVKGTVRSTVTQFEISRNELKGLASQQVSESLNRGDEYAIVLVSNVASDFRPPCVYAVVRDMNRLLDLQPIQFVALFDLHGPRQKRAGDWFDSVIRGSAPSPPPPPPPPPVQVVQEEPEEKPVDPDSIEANFFEDTVGDRPAGAKRKRVSASNPNLTVFGSSSSDEEPAKKKKQPQLVSSSWYF